MEITIQEDKVVWSNVVSLLLFPHAWVRTAACRLLGTLFAAVPAAAPQSELPESSPFSTIGMESVAKKLCLQLRSQNLDATLSLQVVKNLFYVGKCFSLLEAATASGEPESDEEDDRDSDVEDAKGEDSSAKRSHLSWMFSKLSFQARRAHVARRNKSSSPVCLPFPTFWNSHSTSLG